MDPEKSSALLEKDWKQTQVLSVMGKPAVIFLEEKSKNPQKFRSTPGLQKIVETFWALWKAQINVIKCERGCYFRPLFFRGLSNFWIFSS